ncbi:PhaM family polyhydroxyalkanoate granule multifunctional regulatory protein [Sulfuricystis multivorans]|uniref:PhaM family polyhydroxyalkanoate granule multifunctional regulatory protein n=1 Tax=Sulfuricystis multivorans TaxID=2211108 RepID=UPI000F829BE9|nr:PhaM family polyhydroxyalkanoate granule multifunctional regulatory protein [Sulfuricystis multivorans]
MTNASDPNPGDPLEFVKNMWSNMGFALPGMVAPTVDTDELAKRIADLKAVEGWLKSNLNLLQMTIQGLEMQRATLLAFQQMGQAAQEAAKEAEKSPPSNPFLDPAAWQAPWEFMKSALAPEPAVTKAPAQDATAAKPKRSRKKSPGGEPQR